MKRIFNSIDLPKELPVRRKHRDVTANYDVVFLCGDLNFRLDKPREEVIDIVANRWRTTNKGRNASGRTTSEDDDAVGPERSIKDSAMLLESDQLRRSLKHCKSVRMTQCQKCQEKMGRSWMSPGSVNTRNDEAKLAEWKPSCVWFLSASPILILMKWNSAVESSILTSLVD